MNRIRHRHKRAALIRLLVLAVLLRTFIAPGYMLAVSANGLGIVFCDGPVSLAMQPDADQGHHGHHGEPEENGASISPVCSYWSTSGLGFLVPALPSLPSPPAGVESPVVTQARLLPQSCDNSRCIRAPPLPA